MCKLNKIDPYFNSFNVIQSTFSDLIRNDKIKKTSLSSAIYELGSIQCEFNRLQKIEEKLKQYEIKLKQQSSLKDLENIKKCKTCNTTISKIETFCIVCKQKQSSTGILSVKKEQTK